MGIRREPASPLTQASNESSAGTAFTYQGRLGDAQGPVSQSCDFQFDLYTDVNGGLLVTDTLSLFSVAVTDGLFTVELDFGPGVFDGGARYLEIAVRCPAGGGTYTTMLPRQHLTPAPYALALPGLYTLPNPTSTNIVGGFSGNTVTPGVFGGTISGGGTPDDGDGNPIPNRVTDSGGTVSGGAGNPGR